MEYEKKKKKGHRSNSSATFWMVSIVLLSVLLLGSCLLISTMLGWTEGREQGLATKTARMATQRAHETDAGIYMWTSIWQTHAPSPYSTQTQEK